MFILTELTIIDKRLNVGIYRDDGLACSSASRKQVETFKQKIEAIFRRHGLETTTTPNVQKVDFLDVTFDLENGTFLPLHEGK